MQEVATLPSGHKGIKGFLQLGQFLQLDFELFRHFEFGGLFVFHVQAGLFYFDGFLDDGLYLLRLLADLLKTGEADLAIV
ncbi:MAG: hypothetical protein WAR83_07770 [Flavobacteriales bacterium]